MVFSVKIIPESSYFFPCSSTRKDDLDSLNERVNKYFIPEPEGNSSSKSVTRSIFEGDLIFLQKMGIKMLFHKLPREEVEEDNFFVLECLKKLSSANTLEEKQKIVLSKETVTKAPEFAKNRERIKKIFYCFLQANSNAGNLSSEKKMFLTTFQEGFASLGKIDRTTPKILKMRSTQMNVMALVFLGLALSGFFPSIYLIMTSTAIKGVIFMVARQIAFFVAVKSFIAGSDYREKLKIALQNLEKQEQSWNKKVSNFTLLLANNIPLTTNTKSRVVEEVLGSA